MTLPSPRRFYPQARPAGAARAPARRASRTSGVPA